MRPLWTGLALAAVAATVALVVSLDGPADPPPDPDDPTWHVAGSTTGTDRFCGDCHYGLTEMWDATWTRAERNWSLEVAPAYLEAPLWTVQVTDSKEGLVLAASDWLTFDWRAGETWSTTFQVPEDATAVFARLHGTGPDEPERPAGVPDLGRALAMRPNDAVTALRLVAPDGTEHDADGPDADLKMLTVPAQAGSWSLHATLLDGDLPAGVGWASWEALGGEVVAGVPSRSEPLRRTFEGNGTGAPPELWLRLRPYHDHAPYEHTDWDPYDASPFVTRFTAAPGPEPPERVWNRSAVDALWGGAGERVVLERTGSFTGAYVDGEGHNDPGLGSSYPGFGSLGDPVWPGTGTVRFEVTWEPELDLPGMGVRFSPAGIPHFLDATEAERGPGRAVFETAVQPQWWEEPDQVLAWLDPDRVTSYWDIAPLLRGEGPQAHSVDWRLRVVAERG